MAEARAAAPRGRAAGTMANAQQYMQNSVYIRTVPAAATDASLKAFFGPDVTGVKFETFPGSMARFVRVDFGSSNGLTEAILKKGQVLLGVPLDISVMHPVHQQELHKAQAPAAQPAIRPGMPPVPGMPGMPLVPGMPLA